MTDENTTSEEATTSTADESTEESVVMNEDNPTYDEVGDDTSDSDEDTIEEIEETEEYEYADEDTLDDTSLDYTSITNDEDYENTVQEESGTTQDFIETITETEVTSDTFLDESTTQTTGDEVITDTIDYTTSTNNGSDVTVIDNEIETTTTIDEIYDEYDEEDLSENTDEVIQELETLEDNDSIDETLTDDTSTVTITTEADTLYDIVEDTTEEIDENYEEYAEDSPVIVLSDEIDNVTTDEVVTPDLDSTLELTTQATISDDGTITADIDTSKLDVGEHVVQIIYPGDEENEASVGTATITVVEPTLTDTKIVLTGLNAEQVINDTVSYTITLTDVNDTVISNATLTLTGTDGTSITGTTDDKGVITGTFDLTNLGEQKYTVSYNGDTTYNQSSTEITTYVDKQTANVSCTVQTTKISADTDVYYNIYVWNESTDKSLNGSKELTIHIDGVATETITTELSEITKSFNLTQGVHELYVSLAETDMIHGNTSEHYKLYVGMNDVLTIAYYDYDTLGSFLSMEENQYAILVLMTSIDDTSTYIEDKTVNVYFADHQEVTGNPDYMVNTMQTSLPLDDSTDITKEEVQKRHWTLLSVNTTMYLLDYYVSATFDGDDTYTATESSEYMLPVIKRDIGLSINTQTDSIAAGIDYTYYVTLAYNKRNILRDVVHIYVDNEFYQDITTTVKKLTNGSNGSITFPLTLGDHTIYGVFDGNDVYNPTVSNKLTVQARKQCNLILNVPTTNMEVNETTTLSLTVTDAENNALSDEQVQITIGDTVVQGVTDTTGKWTYDYTPTTVGTYTITGYHALTDEYITVTTESTSIKVIDHVLYITAESSTGTAQVNDTKIYTIHTRDSANNPIPRITLNSKLITPPNSTETTGTITTDDDGNATFTCDCTTMGTYHLQFSFDGNDDYLATSLDDISFSVVGKHVTSITINELLHVIDTNTLTIVLTDTSDQVGMSGKELTFTGSDGTTTDTTTATTSSDGIITVDIQG